TFGCYKIKCPRATLPALKLDDQFGSRMVTPTTPRLLCAPVAPPATPTTTTTTTNTTTTTLSSCTFLTTWGMSGSGNGEFNGPFGAVVDGSGNFFVTEYGNSRMQRFTNGGSFITTWGSYGSGNGQFSSAVGVALDASGNVFVADAANNRIQKFTGEGA